MNPFALSGLLIFFSAFSFGVFSWVKGKKFLNKIWAVFNFSVAIWGIGAYKFATAINKESAFLWLRIGHIGVVLIPVLFLHFVFVFLEKRNRKVIFIIYAVGTAFFVLNISDWIGITKLFIVSVQYVFNSFYVDSPPGFLYPVFVAFFFGAVIYGHICAIKYLKISTGQKRAQIKYFLVATSIGFAGGGTAFPMVFGIDLYPSLHFTVFLYPIIMTYAIYKYHLMDLDLAWRYAAAYVGYVLISSAIFLVAILLSKPSRTVVMFLIPLAIISAPYFYKKLMARFQKATLGNKYGYWDELKNFWENKQEVYTAGQLAEVLGEISNVMGLSSFSFFLYDRDRKLFAPISHSGLDGIFDPQQAQVVNTIYPDDALPVYLAHEKRIVIRDELSAQADRNPHPVIEQMDSIKAQVSIPLVVTGKLTAILSLGPKRTGEMYHQQDMELLKQVSRLAEKHLAHISFFDSSIMFSGSVAHDIRKPFRQGIIFDYLANIDKGLERPENISLARESLDNLKHLLSNLRDMSEDMVNTFRNLEIFLKTGFKPQKMDYANLINAESKSFEALSEQKRIAFEIVLPKTELFLYADPLSAQRILNELLTNAFKYTDKGCIKIKVSHHEDNGHKEILTEVTDTGCGIAEQAQEEIWELFKRGENGQKKEGEGIGLAMVRQLVEANGGRIWLKETNPGKGSTFCFVLPVYAGM